HAMPSPSGAFSRDFVGDLDRSPGARADGSALRVLAPMLRVLVLEGLEALSRDLHFDDAVLLDRRLTPEAARRADVEGLVEDVFFFVFGGAQEIGTLEDVDMAGRARADAAARVALGGMDLLRGLEDRRADGHLGLTMA